MKKWEINHHGNVIAVETGLRGERLYINGELQDEQMGLASRARLWGKLKTGESVKVSIGGLLTIQCKIFVGHKLVFQSE